MPALARLGKIVPNESVTGITELLNAHNGESAIAVSGSCYPLLALIEKNIIETICIDATISFWMN